MKVLKFFINLFFFIFFFISTYAQETTQNTTEKFIETIRRQLNNFNDLTMVDPSLRDFFKRAIPKQDSSETSKNKKSNNNKIKIDLDDSYYPTLLRRYDIYYEFVCKIVLIENNKGTIDTIATKAVVVVVSENKSTGVFHVIEIRDFFHQKTGLNIAEIYTSIPFSLINSYNLNKNYTNIGLNLGMSININNNYNKNLTNFKFVIEFSYFFPLFSYKDLYFYNLINSYRDKFYIQKSYSFNFFTYFKYDFKIRKFKKDQFFMNWYPVISVKLPFFTYKSIYFETLDTLEYEKLENSKSNSIKKFIIEEIAFLDIKSFYNFIELGIFIDKWSNVNSDLFIFFSFEKINYYNELTKLEINTNNYMFGVRWFLK